MIKSAPQDTEKKVFIKDELDTDISQIQKFEDLSGLILPVDYKTFLLQYNGCTVYPNLPVLKADTNYEFPFLRRLLSIGDLILQCYEDLLYTNKDAHKEYDADKYSIDLKKLVTIGIGDAGGCVYHIYLGEEDYGQLYVSGYSDWDGLVRIECNSIHNFINSFRSYEDYEEGLDMFRLYNIPSAKVFDSYLLYTKSNPELGLERFKEVLQFYGDPNLVHARKNINVVQNYVDSRLFLGYLISIGGEVEGLLNYTKQFDTIQNLIQTHHQDINKPYKGYYPLQNITNPFSWYEAKMCYELFDKLLIHGYDLDLDVIDAEGKNIKDRLRKVVEKYNEYERFVIKNYKNSKEKFLVSEGINKLLAHSSPYQ
jgi:SMI1-KNR4 cell-wall